MRVSTLAIYFPPRFSKLGIKKKSKMTMTKVAISLCRYDFVNADFAEKYQSCLKTVKLVLMIPDFKL